MKPSLSQRFFAWVLKRFGVPALLEIGLLCLILTLVTRGLVGVASHLSIRVVYPAALLGVLAGWLLARSSLNGWKYGVAGFGIGFGGLALTVGRIGGLLGGLLAGIPPLVGELFQCTIRISSKPFLTCATLDPLPLSEGWSMLVDGVVTLAGRIGIWFGGLFSGLTVTDPLLTGMVWGMILWLVAIWAARWIARRNMPLAGLLPALALLGYNIYYTNSVAGILWLVFASGGTVLFQALIHYLESDERWTSRRMGRVTIEADLGIAAGLLVVGLMLAGGLLPAISIAKVRSSLHELFDNPNRKNGLAESLGLQQTPMIGSNGIGSTAGGMGQAVTHAVGAGPHLSQDVVMYVTVEGYKPPPPPDVARYTNAPPPDVRYYWRLQTYAGYNGRDWFDDSLAPQAIPANRPFEVSLAALPVTEREVHQQVERVQQLNGALFFSGELVSVDQPAVASWRASNDLIDAQTNAVTYNAVSRLPYVTEAELRAAGTNFPVAIRSRYLSLPDNVPQRVRDLALNLTAHKGNLYDRAIAIQDYLRQFPYTVDVPGPPADREVSDYFIFDLKKGYCDYFATSMVVLARAAGLPSRLVTGYASGSYDYTTGRFVVVNADAHAWVEIYFPDIGWVEFEPTTNLTPIPHPGEVITPANAAAALPTPVAQAQAPVQNKFNFGALRTALQILGVLLAGLAVVAVLAPLEGWLLVFRPADLALTTIYSRLYRRGRAWGVDVKAGLTPNEFAAALSVRLEPLARYRRLAAALAILRADLEWLTGTYSRLLFSPRRPSRDEHLRAVRTWMRMQWNFFWLRLGRI